uniref:preprotein translocase subunit SecA n=1 Tax=Haramonas pauciplastida TaxID=478668 RepID=UPI0021142A5A|nr:preprotein translocase subunit SecA [Haramonas pauciplastida]YP_010444177.1 preprotein translocase subunit SecA [Haramonas pauciplastida]UTE95035.1 preprotein translocase subunit SecA [Haramonas pauciplastida]UTE95063.1 preprotein translocase subunit SecA [Haramonas pauciplastida]
MRDFFSEEKFVIQRYGSLLNHISNFENSLKNISQQSLKEKVIKLQKRCKVENKLSKELVIQSFGLTREAALRSIGLKHYPQQVLGGLALHDGKIAEMKTGEGKTLVATLPASLNALTKKGTQIITVNEYLAKRDAKAMVPIYKQLGLTVGLIQSDTSVDGKKEAYLADITYVTSSEIGFDYLRDNMAFSSQDIVQRKLNYCILDEVDAVLIDEARTPLVLSGKLPANPKSYIQASEIAKYLESPRDYETNEKTTNVILTEQGIYQIEKILGLSSIFETSEPWVFYVINALKAKNFFLRNSEYIIKDNQIIIVDQFTGRLMPDRRWSNGIHEAVEAKENIITKYSTNQASSITYQSLFTLYPKLSGMTGTAKTAENELEQIYGLEVFVIPTFKPFIRKDIPDKIYINEAAKWRAVATECTTLHEIGRPVLIGTNTIEKSELLSILLDSYKIPHKILNAKSENLNFESEIVAQAGRKGSITVATNMAGRGTDIILGGSRDFKNEQFLESILLDEGLRRSKIFLIRYLVNYHFSLTKNLEVFDPNKIFNEMSADELEFILFPIKKTLLDKRYSKTLLFYLKTNYKFQFEKESNYIKSVGGLCVIGTERNDSQRIDNQLRGRAGRQGDPGSSIFFVSLDDKTFRLFGSSNIQKAFSGLELGDLDISIDSKFLRRSLELAQKSVEDFYYDGRKQTYEYDGILDEQRMIFYHTRSFVLKTDTIQNWVCELGEQALAEIAYYLCEEIKIKQNLEQIQEALTIIEELLQFTFPLEVEDFVDFSEFSLYNFLREQYWLIYEFKESNDETKGKGALREFEKICFLQTFDECWAQHLSRMSDLMEYVGWRAYAQRDPLDEYKSEAYRLFITSTSELPINLVFAVLSNETGIEKFNE